MCNFFCALALLATTSGHAFFPPADNPGVTWSVTGTPQLYSDVSGAFVFSAEPSSSVGCLHPRFSVDFPNAIPLAVYCQGAFGDYFLLATAG